MRLPIRVCVRVLPQRLDRMMLSKVTLRLRPLPCGDGVVTKSTNDEVIACTGRDDVVTCTAIKHIIAKCVG